MPVKSAEIDAPVSGKIPRRRAKKKRKKQRQATSEWEWSREFLAGYEGRYNLPEKSASYHRAVIEMQSQLKQLSASPLNFSLAGRLRSPSNRKNSGNDASVDLKEAYVEKSVDQVSFGLGLHQVSWGETFGFYNITDVVNPVDFYEAQDVDPGEAKIPVVLAVLTWSPTPFTVQLISGPAPRRSRMPHELNGVLLDEAYTYTFIDDGEYGGRIGYLFPFGLDLKVFSYMHWNRRPAYGLRLIGAEPRVFLQERLLATSGASFSQAFDSIVIRGDIAYTDRTPVTDMTIGGQQKTSNLAQGVMGTDYTSEDGLTTVGLQGQIDHWTQKNPAFEKRYLTWGGARGSASVLSEVLTLECTILRGLNNHDTLVQPGIGVEPCCGLELDLQGYFVFSREDGDREFIQRTRELYSRFSWRF